MVFQDWSLPIIFSVIFLDFGIIWALRLKKSCPAKDLSASPFLPALIWNHSERIYKFLMIFLGMGIFILSWLSSSNLYPRAKWAGYVLMSIGIFGGVIGLGTILQPRVDKVFCRFAKKLHTPPVQFVFMLSALQFALVAGISSVYSATAFNQALATLSWGLGVSAVILGGWVSGYTKRKPDWQSVLWFTMLTSVAFLLRGIRTSHIPISMTGDEGNFGLWAYQMALGKPNNLFETGSYGFPTLYMFIQSILIRFLGPTSQAIRLSSALIGAFTVGCTYLFGKSLINHRVGAFAGIFLAFFHFHIHFSRLGLNNIWDGFWFVLVFAAFWEGWLTRKKNAFILSGLGMGFSQYFYASARLLPFILLFWISVLAFADRPRFRKQLLEIGVLFFAALIVVLPLGIYFFAHPSTYFDPMHQTNIFGIWSRGGHEGFTNFWSFLFAQLRLGFLAYTSAPVVFFYDPGIPILRALPAFFFALGLFVLVGFHQNAKTWLFLLWLIVIALVGALSKPTPSAQRYIAAAPALALIIGAGLAQVLVWKEKIPAIKGRKLFANSISFLTVLGLILIGMGDLKFYFVDFLGRNYKQWENTYKQQSIAEHLVNIPGEWEVVYLGAEQEHYVSNPIAQFLNPRLKKDHILLLNTTSPLNLFSPESSLVFLFLPEQESYLNAIQLFYPHGEIIEERGGYERTLYWLYVYRP